MRPAGEEERVVVYAVMDTVEEGASGAGRCVAGSAKEQRLNDPPVVLCVEGTVCVVCGCQ